MKDIIIKSMLTFTIFAACAQISMAESMPYEPVFENLPVTETVEQQQMPAVSKIEAVPQEKATPVNNSVEAGNLQNALIQLDTAQVEIRNTLIQYKTEFTDIDAQYRDIKEKRAAKLKQIKETEKKIKNLDKMKEKIRKDMN